MSEATLSRRVGTIGILVLGIVACGSKEPHGEPTGSVEAALAPAAMRDLFGFEDRTLWTSTTAALISSTVRIEGDFSLGIGGGGFHFIDSVPLSTFDLTDDKVRLSVRIPTSQPNPWWFGDVQIYVDAPSAGVYSQYVGYKALTGLPTGSFVPLEFTLPPAVVSNLAGSFNDLVIRLALNVPQNQLAVTLFDNLVFGGVSVETLSKAPIGLAPEPLEDGALVYLPLAPEQGGQSPYSQFAVSLLLTNEWTTPVVIQDVELSFSGGASVPAQVLPVDMSLAAGGTVRRNTMMGFATATDPELNENVFLPEPAATQVTIRVTAEGFPEPAEMTLPLVPYVPSTPSGAYRFWSNEGDMVGTEFWSLAQGRHPSGHGDAPQILALDAGVVRYIPDGGGGSFLSGIAADADPMNLQNEDFFVWHKPIRAIADGVVLSVLNDVPTNPVGQLCSDPATMCPCPSGHTCVSHGNGNHVYVQHGDDIVLYAHFDIDTIPAGIVEGAVVTAGQKLGEAGNSGNSSGPHLHIHAMRTTGPDSGMRPLPFENVHAIGVNLVTTPNPAAVWSLLDGEGFPRATIDPTIGSPSSVIWPSATHP